MWKEFDLTLGYTSGGFHIGITDYWFSLGLDPDGRYFKYDAHGTNHIFEATLGYDFGPVALRVVHQLCWQRWPKQEWQACL